MNKINLLLAIFVYMMFFSELYAQPSMTRVMLKITYIDSYCGGANLGPRMKTTTRNFSYRTIYLFDNPDMKGKPIKIKTNADGEKVIGLEKLTYYLFLQGNAPTHKNPCFPLQYQPVAVFKVTGDVNWHVMLNIGNLCNAARTPAMVDGVMCRQPQ